MANVAKPPGISPPSKQHRDVRREQQPDHSGEKKSAVHGDYYIAIFAERGKTRR
jgi:hypothetical protein